MFAYDVPLVAFVRVWVDSPGRYRVNRTWRDSYVCGDVWEVSTGRLIPVRFQRGRDPEAAVRAACPELGDGRLVISVTEVATEDQCRYGADIRFYRAIQSIADTERIAGLS